MSTEGKFDRAMEVASEWGQEHLLRFYQELDEAKRECLVDDILGTDFSLVCGLYTQAKQSRHADVRPDAIRPYEAIDKRSLPQSRMKAAYDAGMGVIGAGLYAVVTMAGGQGTRLGHPGPKGTYGIRLDRDTTLFEVYLRRIAEMRCRTGAKLPWYIMTSDENHAATVGFFEDNGYFGCDDIAFFRQGSLPMVGMDGKILLDEKHSIKRGPDGNGSVFKAMHASGIAEDMRRRGIEWFFMGNVDNILAQCTDPLPVGLAVLEGLPAASKSILKRSPDEKVGVYCRVDGRPHVIEYTELPGELAALRDNAGHLIYGDAHISCMAFHIGVLDMRGAVDMPYHTAVKKASHVNEEGMRVEPDKPNAYKFESFIFDIFPQFQDLAVLRADRDSEFAPIKNASGDDSPETARYLYMKSLQKGE